MKAHHVLTILVSVALMISMAWVFWPDNVVIEYEYRTFHYYQGCNDTEPSVYMTEGGYWE